MDEHVPRSISVGLRLRGVDIITAYEDGASGMSDQDLLDRACELNRVIFTQDDDFLVEAARRQKEGIPFRGVIYAHQLRISIRECVDSLEMIAKIGEPEDMSDAVQFLPF
jgi:predicted nuclease of predicted toxin-antitoxin system